MTRRLLSLARDTRIALAATVLCGFLAGLLTIGQASALSQVLERVFLGGQALPDVAALLRVIIIIVLFSPGRDNHSRVFRLSRYPPC